MVTDIDLFLGTIRGNIDANVSQLEALAKRLAPFSVQKRQLIDAANDLRDVRDKLRTDRI